MYRSMLKNLRDYRQPEGAFEEFLTEMIAGIAWRLRCHIAAESAEIRCSCEFVRGFFCLWARLCQKEEGATCQL